MAKVDVRMYATVRAASGSSACTEEASDLMGLLRALARRYGQTFRNAVGTEDAPFERAVVLVNGVVIPPDGIESVVLTEGDEVSLFPPISGG